MLLLRAVFGDQPFDYLVRFESPDLGVLRAEGGTMDGQGNRHEQLIDLIDFDQRPRELNYR